jgi:hypothetical protein
MHAVDRYLLAGWAGRYRRGGRLRVRPAKKVGAEADAERGAAGNAETYTAQKRTPVSSGLSSRAIFGVHGHRCTVRWPAAVFACHGRSRYTAAPLQLVAAGAGGLRFLVVGVLANLFPRRWGEVADNGMVSAPARMVSARRIGVDMCDLL